MNLNKIYLVILLLGWGSVAWGQCFTLEFTVDDVEVMPGTDNVISVCGDAVTITVLGPLMEEPCEDISDNIQYEWFVLNNINEVLIGSDSETLEITNTDYNGDEIFIRVTDLVDEDDEMDDVVLLVESFVANITPSLEIMTDDNFSICSGEGGTGLGVTVTEGSGDYTYQWSNTSFLDNPSSANPTINSLLAQAITFTVTVTDQGCSNDISAMATQAVTITPSLEIMTDNDFSICSGEGGTGLGITVTEGSGDYTYQWSNTSFLINPSSATPTINNTLEQAITFTVTVTDQGCSNDVSATATQAVNIIPSLEIMTDDDFSICSGEGGTGLDVTVTEGSGDYNYEWSNTGFLDDNTIENPTINSTLEQAVTFTVTVTDLACNDVSATATQAVTVESPTVLSLIDDTEVCDDADPVDLNPSPSGSDENFVVTFTGTGMGNIGNVIQGNEFIPEEATPGRYSITYTQSGCIIPAMVDITVNSLPDISAATDFNICQGADRDLGVSITDSVGVYGYGWNNGGFLDDPQIPNPTLSSNLPVGETTFTVTVTDDNNCASTEEQTVNVVAQPTNIIIGEEVACVGGQALLTAVLAGGGIPEQATYQWTTPSNTMPLGESIQADIFTIGDLLMYSVEVSFPDSIGCNTVTNDISISPDPTPVPRIRIIGDSTNICEGQEIIFVAEDGDEKPDEYSLAGIDAQWIVDGVEINEEDGGKDLVLITTAPSGSNSINIEFKASKLNCDGADIMKLTFSGEVAPDPAIIFRSAVNDILVYNDDTACSYQWGYYEETNNGIILMELPGDTFQSYVPDLYDENKTYWCRADDCGTGCSNLAVKSGSNEAPVDVQPPFLMYPNPTSSRLNVEINRLIPEAIYDLRIFNSLGQLVKTMKLRAKGGSLAEEIDVSTQQEGVYHLTLVREGQFLATWPFVIQR